MSTAPTRIRLVLVEDSEVVRMGLRALLGTDRHFEIAAEASGVGEGIEACLRHRPDVALLDLRLPDGTGFEACRQILRRLPDTRVLILTSVVDDEMIAEAIRAGAHATS